MNNIFNPYSDFTLVYLDDVLVFSGFEIFQGTITPISRSIEFVDNFPNEIKDKVHLQRFLECVNYVSNFIPNLKIYT